MTDTAVPHTHTAHGKPWAWRGTDFIVGAVFGVAMGIVFLAWDYLLNAPWTALTLAFPPAASLAMGVWLLPPVAGSLIIRRPGSALFVGAISAFVEYLLGNPWGPAVLLSALVQALGVELVMALFRWRRFGLAYAMTAGAAAAIAEVTLYEWWTYFLAYSWGWKLATLAFAVASGLLLAGVGAHYLVRALAKSGALSGFPAGAEAILRRGTVGE